VAKAIYQIALFMVCVVLAQPAVAHPHIFAKYEVDITQKDDAAYALHFTFRVRNVVTPNPLIRDQQYKTDNLLDAMAQHPIYIFLDVDGRPVGQQNVELTRAGETDHEPIYTFDMEIPAGAGDFGFLIYDSEYYDAVALAGADALRVKIAKLSCWASHEDVGETMWGINSTTRVECGDSQHPISRAPPSKKLPLGGPLSGKQDLPP
jgi:ABC-type uncharacterized transport system substrate-binding protein